MRNTTKQLIIKLYDRAETLQNNKSEIDTLLAVLLKELLLFFQKNFLTNNRFNIPKFTNPIFIYHLVNFIYRLWKIIKTYKNDKNKFKEKYLNKVLNSIEFTTLLYH